MKQRNRLKQNSKKVFDFHNKNGTVPEKIDIHRFPRPFLSKDTIFKML